MEQVCLHSYYLHLHLHSMSTRVHHLLLYSSFLAYVPRKTLAWRNCAISRQVGLHDKAAAVGCGRNLQGKPLALTEVPAGTGNIGFYFYTCCHSINESFTNLQLCCSHYNAAIGSCSLTKHREVW